MSSDQQIAANRLNAQRSTGPRTPAGKAKVSVNSLKHGLTARDMILPNEDPNDFGTFRSGILTSLDPRGALEGALAEKIVADLWRLRRVSIVEAALYRRGCKELVASQAAEAVREYESLKMDSSVYVAPRNHQAHADAEEKLARAQAESDDPTFNITRALEMFREPFKNLERHEAALSRSLLRMMHELERCQAKRAGEHVPAPVVVDVDVSLPEPPRADIGKAVPNEETDENQQ